MSELQSSKYLTLLQNVDYRAIANGVSSAKQKIDYYLVIRAEIILGNYEKAMGYFRKWFVPTISVSGKTSCFYACFLQIQLDIFRRQNLQKSIMDLSQLMIGLPKDRFMVAEFHFVLGYLHNLLDEFKQGTRHHRLAADHYRTLNLFGCEAVATFNLCICYNHLNERELFELNFGRLDQIHSRCKNPTTSFFFRRLGVYRMVDRQEFSNAIKELYEIIPLARRLDRIRDLGGVVCLLCYLLLKTKRDCEFLDFYERNIKGWVGSLNVSHKLVIKEFLALQAQGLISRTEVKTLLRRWKRPELDTVNYLFLVSLLLDLLRHGGDFELLVRVAHQASQLSLRKQQALSLTDFRFYEVLGLIKCGQIEKATRQLNMYLSESQEQEAENKIHQAKSLQKLLAEQSAIPVDSLKSKELVFDNFEKTIYFRGRTIQLRGKAVLQRLFEELVKHGGHAEFPTLFYRVYQLNYNPILHERRMHSLLDRARRLLGDRNTIVRQDGKVGFSPGIRVRCPNENKAERAIEERRGKLFQIIESSSHPLTVSDLESVFDCSRRTIQFDLHHLVDTNAISTMGKTRNRRYFVEVSSGTKENL